MTSRSTASSRTASEPGLQRRSDEDAPVLRECHRMRWPRRCSSAWQAPPNASAGSPGAHPWWRGDHHHEGRPPPGQRRDPRRPTLDSRSTPARRARGVPACAPCDKPQGDRDHAPPELDAPGASHVIESCKQQSSSAAAGGPAAGTTGQPEPLDRLTPARPLSQAAGCAEPAKATDTERRLCTRSLGASENMDAIARARRSRRSPLTDGRSRPPRGGLLPLGPVRSRTLSARVGSVTPEAVRRGGCPFRIMTVVGPR
jgi:hypothetical protein